MPRSQEEQELNERFKDHYSRLAHPALQELERRVLGSDYGASGHTDVAQALRLIEMLDLGPDSHLLEVGAGAGWPGLFLARQTACRVTLTDLPLEGLRLSQARAKAESVAAGSLAASGAHVPFGPETFHAVSSSDVLC